jgi:dihydrofolate reductase
MSRLLVRGYTISLDGYGAGPGQSREAPLGVGGERLHEWLVHTPTFTGTHGSAAGSGSSDVDEEFAARAMANLGAWIMGRNMFGPIRGGSWGDESWTGWWGDNPPYHHPVFVLTHVPRAPLEMEGGTTFYFVTDGIEAARDAAIAAAAGKDVRVGGGVATVQAYLRAGLIDEMHITISPVLLGSGERLFDHLGATIDGYEVVEIIGSGTVSHVRIARR